MKILVLTNLYPPHYVGGYEIICHTVVNELRRRGHDIGILTSNHRVEGCEDDPSEWQVERTLRIHGLYQHPWLAIPRLQRLEHHNNQTLVAGLRQFRPDLVYIWNMGGLSKSMLFTLQKSGLPTVFYLSDHWIARGLASDVWLRWWNTAEGSFPQRLLRKLWTRMGLRERWNEITPTFPIEQLRFRRIYFCSRALRDLTAKAGFDVGHGEVIYVPVDLSRFNGKPRCAAEPLQRLLYVGRLSPDKGVMSALRALAFLRNKFTGSLSIYGGGEASYVAQLRQFATENRVAVTWASATTREMPQIYRNHDALLFTSEWAEPFALTPIEAMGCGLPVIGTTTGGSAELFRHGDNALTYAAGNAHQLADRILQLAHNSELRAKLAASGHAEVRQKYDVPVIVDQIERYLAESVTPIPRTNEHVPVLAYQQ